MTSADLAGMTPDQVLAVMKSDTEREALRNKSVVDVFESSRIPSEIELREATSRKLGSEAYLMEHPEIAHVYNVDLERVRKAKTPEELEKIRSETSQNYSHGRYLDTHAKDISALTKLRVDEITFKNKYSEEVNKGYIDVKMPDGQEARMHVKDALDVMYAKGHSGGDPKSALELEQYMNKVEAYMAEQPNSPTIPGYIDSWNKYSDKKYIYTYEDKIAGKNLTRVPLPSLGGNPLTARQVTAMKSEAERRKGKAMSWAEFLPMLGVRPSGEPIKKGSDRAVLP